MIKVITSLTPRTRLRARPVLEHTLGERVRALAIETGEWQADVSVGGSVRNAYKFPAYTEVALAISDPTGLTLVFLAIARCNGGCSESKAAGACVAGAGPYFDGRVKDPMVLDQSLRALQAAHGTHFSPLARFGAALDDTEVSSFLETPSAVDRA